jgi:ATP-dependent Clp protease ATP-binding subunit ClpC
MPKDIIDKFSNNLKDVLTRALCFAAETNHETVKPEHLLWAVATQKGCVGAEVLKIAGLKTSGLNKFFGATKTQRRNTYGRDASLRLSEESKQILEKAVLSANKNEHGYIGTEHLLSGMLQSKNIGVKKIFSLHGVNLDELNSQLAVVMETTSKFSEFIEMVGIDGQKILEEMKVLNEAGDEHTPKRISATEYFSVELTGKEVQKRIDPLIGRDEEVERMMEILCRRTKNNPLLIGEPGVGKTAIVEGLAKKISQGDVPPALLRKKIFAVDIALLLSGTMYRGEFEARLKQIIDEAKRDEDTILFIDEIHTIVGAGSATGTMDAANILKPALARGEIRCIGATTPGEYKKQIEPDAALDRRLQPIIIDEPNKEEALEMLEGVAPCYERFHKVRITHDALKEAVRLSERYIQDRRLPDKAIDLIDEAAAAIRVRNYDQEPVRKERLVFDELNLVRRAKQQAVIEERFDEAEKLKEHEERLSKQLEKTAVLECRDKAPTITPDDIARVVARRANVPLANLTDENFSLLATLESCLSDKVLGQEEVIRVVAGALRRAKTGIAHPSRPLASFLFLGPSGVGKTELAKTIALTLFDSKNNFIRLDMSEYSEGFTTSKLIGAPAGYVGYRDVANLTDRVKAKPHCVILFDEIEKAHRDVQNLLLQILEEGELTDATGKTVNFKNTIVILTSNAVSEKFERGEIGFSETNSGLFAPDADDIRRELGERFRPELINRIDHVCIFKPLEKNTLAKIADKQLAELAIRLREQGVALNINPNVPLFICSNTETKLGARNIRSKIQTQIEHKIAELMSKNGCGRSFKAIVKNRRVVITNE